MIQFNTQWLPDIVQLIKSCITLIQAVHLKGVCGPQTGWYQAGEDWYYMRGGCVVTGSNTIDGNQYYFDSNGVWVPEW